MYSSSGNSMIATMRSLPLLPIDMLAWRLSPRLSPRPRVESRTRTVVSKVATVQVATNRYLVYGIDYRYSILYFRCVTTLCCPSDRAEPHTASRAHEKLLDNEMPSAARASRAHEKFPDNEMPICRPPLDARPLPLQACSAAATPARACRVGSASD